jgi:hypothetical protein
MSLFRHQTAEEKAARRAAKQAHRDEFIAKFEARRAESRERSDARKHEKDEARREKVEQAIAPYLAGGDEVAYLVKFKQGEEIFTDYLAVTTRSLLIVTGLIADSPDVKVVPFRGVSNIAGREGHLTVGIDGKQRNFHHIRPREQAHEIVAFISARL